MKTDKEIIVELIDALDIKSVNKFAKDIGYATSSNIFNIFKDDSRNITNDLIHRIINKFPQVNKDYLRKKSDQMFIEVVNLDSDSENFTLNDLPKLFVLLLKEQKKTNELLTKILDK